MIKGKIGDLEIETILVIILVLLVVLAGAIFIYFKGTDILDAMKNFFRSI